MRPATAVWAGLVTAAAVMVLDQATKQLALAQLTPGRRVPVAGGWLGWELTFNPGGAFGLPAPSWFFLVVTVAVVAIVLRNLPRTRDPMQAAALGLLLAGALGNVVDRLLRPGDATDPRYLHGHVVDFIALELPVIGPWPRFNVADVAITLGFVLLVLGLARELRSTSSR